MKWTALLTLCAAACLSQNAPEPKYEMDRYVVGILRRGPNTSQPKEEAEKIQEGHMAHLGKMGATGKLIVAGPFTGNNQDARGMLIFKTTLEDARAMATEDPAVKAGRLVVDLYPWFAAKGLKIDPPK